MRSAQVISPVVARCFGISLQRVPHVEAWRVGCHLSSPPRHSTGVPNDTSTTGYKESPTATRRSFQARFNVPKGPDVKTIRTLFAKFQRTGSVGNVGRKQTAVTPQNVATVSGIIQQNPMSSVRRTASESGLKRSST
ncbi:uncharacterized protein TNCV_4489671 [Trichonephila clavipes]|nr:uncharacterized protein TNCV_4489671 [Trichonephila clavipes]